MSKHKINPSNKIDAVQRIMEGSEGLCQAARRLNISPTSVKQWMSIYNSDGIDGFHSTGNKKYSKELKEQAVLDYLAGKGSQQSICQRYGIKSKSKLQLWIKKYNGHDELISRGTGGFKIMTKGRKTTFDERIEIVQYALHMITTMRKHQKNFRYHTSRQDPILSSLRPAASKLCRITEGIENLLMN